MKPSDERGAISVTLLALLPLVLATACFLIGVAYLLRTHSGAVHECRVQLMRAEEKRLAKAHALFRLNSSAKRLRIRREIAEQVLEKAVASGNGPAILVAEANLATVVAKQMVLAARQKILLVQAETGTRLALAKLKRDLRKRHESDARLFGGRFDRVFQNAKEEAEPLAVIAEPASALTPDYVPRNDFEERETLRVRWTFLPAHLLPDWLGLADSRTLSLAVQGQCATTAEKKKGVQWRARLQADKP